MANDPKGSMADLFLKSGRDKSTHNRHPWIFGGAVERIAGEVADGDLVAVRDTQGRFLGRGYLNRQSQIAVRMLSWEEDETIDGTFWRRRIGDAVARRRALIDERATTAYRLIYAESDLLPGLIVDRYDDFLVVQCLTLGIARCQEEIVRALVAVLSPSGVYERSDVDVREREGLPPTAGTLYGSEPPPEIEIVENGYRFLVDIQGGQKTGFYLDQRENRWTLLRYAKNREVLNAFAYTGAFGVYAAGAGAGPVTHLDTSAGALALADRNVRLNGFHGREDAFVQGNVFQVLRAYRDRGRSFDLIILDPPKFAPTRKHIHRASRAYKDLNLLAIKLLRPGGILFTFSCSGGIDASLFQKIVFGASVDAQRDVQAIEPLAQGADHPVLLSFPESAYLKGLVCRVL
jgi:23S rRNA (cytosine1962-C5)-methyltransferase